MYACVCLCVLASYTDSLGVKYLAVLVVIMSPKAMSSFTVSIWFVCNTCVCACVYMHSCVCPAWHQPRSDAKLPISEAQSIKTPLTTHLREKNMHTVRNVLMRSTHTHTYTHIILYICTTPPSLLLLTTLGQIHSQIKVI